MNRIIQLTIAVSLLTACSLSSLADPAQPTSVALNRIAVDQPMPPPDWALLERELLRANTAACEEFFGRYFDERGYLMCVERWGGDDGPDDAMENCNDWPMLHALGASPSVLRMYKKAWEGHLRQYTEARTTEVPIARDGMYYKEFPVMFDWVHNGEGLSVFSLQGLSDPGNDHFQKRVKRFAGFYMNEDPGAPNYDPKHKIIRSMFNGSRGPLLRKATGLDWAGDPIEIKNRFHLGHGEESYEQMVAHFKDYNDIVGDHPQNLLTTSLALNAYMLTGDDKYRDWLLEYVGAWRQRMLQNDGIIPSNIGLDGTIGGAAGGKWYGGVYGWGFTVVVPQDDSLANRNTVHLGFTGFMNAYFLTGDDRWLEPWRWQNDLVNSQGKMIDGQWKVPRMHGDQGWYHFQPGYFDYGSMEIFYLSMKPNDLRRLRSSDDDDPGTKRFRREDGWLRFLLGNNPGHPVDVLRADFASIRERVKGMRADKTTPDTRLADDPMRYNPCSVRSLIPLMLGGIHPGHRGAILHCRLRYFDPVRHRAGIPDDVAALVEKLTADEVVVTLVNVNQIEPRRVIVQAGGYAEHQFITAVSGGQTVAIDAPTVEVRLAPGAGEQLTFRMKRYANRPTLSLPWDQP